MNTTLRPHQAVCALAIADAAMFDQLIEHGCPGDDGTVGLCDADCHEVRRMANASPALRMAYDWLHDRGYVRLTVDRYGELVEVIRRPGEAA